MEELLTIAELAKAIKVPKSWIYLCSMPKRGARQIPVVKVGKYNRYYLSQVMDWLKKQKFKEE